MLGVRGSLLRGRAPTGFARLPPLRLVDAALHYATVLGWHVFPLRPGEKSPLLPGAQHDATVDPNLITAWWSAQPNANIGLALRASGMLAVDVDPRNGGIETLAALEAQHGPLPRALVQQSPSGGFHFLLSDPGGHAWRGKLAQGTGVDVQSLKYIAVAPSVLADGRAYAWRAVSTPPPPPPDAWIALLAKPGAQEGAPEIGLEVWQHSTDGPLAPADAERLRGDLRGLGQRGCGKSTTFAAIRTIFHGYGLGIDDGWPFLLEWSAGSGRPHTHDELVRQVHRIVARGDGEGDGERGHRRREGVGFWTQIARAPSFGGRGGPAPFDPAAPVVGALITAPPPDPGTFAGELARALVEVRDALGVAGQQSAPRPLFEPVANLFSRQFSPTPWLVTNLITEGGVGAIATEPKAGKTWVGTEIALAVASGLPVFGKYNVKRMRVAYFYAEDMGQQVRNRVRALCAARNVEPELATQGFFAQGRGEHLDLARDEDCARLIASCRRFGDIGLLVIDPMRDVHSGEEDKSDQMRVVMLRLKVIGQLLGCTVLFVHHAKKDTGTGSKRGGQKMRGSSAIHGSVDFALYLSGLSGDGESVISNRVESEVKGARGAGYFDLTLTIRDNEHGEAVHAAWTWSKTTDAERDLKKLEDVEAKILTVVHGRPMLRIDQVVAAVGGGPQTRALVKEMIKRGALGLLDANAGKFCAVTRRPAERDERVVPPEMATARAQADLPPIVAGSVASNFLKQG